MDQRLSQVTLGVTDLDRSRQFYDALGWAASPSPDHIAFYQLDGVVLALWDRSALAADSGVEFDDAAPDDGDTWGAKVLGLVVSSAADVDEQLAQAEEAGATILQTGTNRFWGGYAGVFTDPDGHAWEIVYNPFWTLDEKGHPIVNDGRG